MITVKKPSEEEKKTASGWPIWEKEVSKFPWEYTDKETCYILSGEVKIHTDDGITEFGSGDWVEFPKGLKCTWEILKPVKKHYKFG